MVIRDANAEGVPAYRPQQRHSLGLDAGRVVPIDGGGRLTGKIGKITLNLLNVQGGEVATPSSSLPATNFSVMRIKRDFLKRSNFGALYTRRLIATGGQGPAETFGVDATLRPSDHVTINTYLAKTQTPGLSGDDKSYQVQIDYSTDRYGLNVDQLAVGDHFNPDVGYVQRDDLRRTSGEFRFSPRPRASKVVRKFTYDGSYDYLTDGQGKLETRAVDGLFAIDFQNSDRLSAQYRQSYEFLKQPFKIGGLSIPVGGYGFRSASIAIAFDGLALPWSSPISARGPNPNRLRAWRSLRIRKGRTRCCLNRRICPAARWTHRSWLITWVWPRGAFRNTSRRQRASASPRPYRVPTSLRLPNFRCSESQDPSHSSGSHLYSVPGFPEIVLRFADAKSNARMIPSNN